MIILTIRTDKPEAEVGVYDGQQRLAYVTWHAHRELSSSINHKIIDVLQSAGVHLHDLQAIAAFKGPGSFTGLRIGLSVANALAYSLATPVVSTQGEDWLTEAIDRLTKNDNEHIAVPEYGAPVHITAPRH